MTVKELYQYCYKDGSEEYEIALAASNDYGEGGYMLDEDDIEIDDRMKEVVLH